MSEELRMVAAVLAVMAATWVVAHRERRSDDTPQGNAESFNAWQKRCYLVDRAGYYRIHPPNGYESYEQRRDRYRKYCLQKSRRSSNG